MGRALSVPILTEKLENIRAQMPVADQTRLAVSANLNEDV